jgi:hypothetical protein
LHKIALSPIFELSALASRFSGGERRKDINGDECAQLLLKSEQINVNITTKVKFGAPLALT